MVGNLLKRFFPIPHFLSSPSFGLDLSDESLKFAQLVPSASGVKLGKFGERRVPPGLIESGKIKDPKKLEEFLATWSKEENIRSVRVSLPEEQIYIFRFDLPKEGLSSVREGIELSLEEHIPIPAEDSIFDYTVLRETSDNLRLEVVAIPRHIIENYLLVFKGAMIEVKSFELEAQAIKRSVIKNGDLGTYMIVDFGEKRTGIFIISRAVVMFTSTLSMGGAMLTDMIKKSFNISREEAEEMKRVHGLDRNPESRELFAVILNSVSIMRDEIAKHFLYWHTHKDDEKREPIEKIILCGGDSNLRGLSEYLSMSLKTKVELGNCWVNVLDVTQEVPKIKFNKSLTFTAALGLALGDFEYD